MVALAFSPARAQQGTLAPSPVLTILDSSGNPVSGAKLYVYLAGTSTAATVYTDAARATPWANPAVADAAGRLTVYLTPGVSYKFIAKTSADVTLWTVDGVGSVPPAQVDLDVEGTAGEALTAGNAVFISDGTGGRTAGRWYKTDSDTASMSSTAVVVGIVPADISSGNEGSIRLQGRITGLVGLSAGSSYYISATAGGITSSAPANQRFLGFADSTTSLVLTPAQSLVNANLSVTSLTTTGAISAGTTVAAGTTVTATTDVVAGDQLFERGRSVAVGEWATVAFSAGNFNAGGAWTVESGDMQHNRYTLIGKTMIWQFWIEGSALSTDAGQLLVTIPGSHTANTAAVGTGYFADGAVEESLLVRTSAGGTEIFLDRPSGANFTSGAVDTIRVAIAFEIQ